MIFSNLVNLRFSVSPILTMMHLRVNALQDLVGLLEAPDWRSSIRTHSCIYRHLNLMDKRPSFNPLTIGLAGWMNG